jgi:hypothetical protein
MAKQKKQAVDEQTAQAAQAAQALDELKAKLRKKYYLLRDDVLNQDDLQALKDHVGAVNGWGKAETDQRFSDLL